jgi:hypothetical protein
MKTTFLFFVHPSTKRMKCYISGGNEVLNQNQFSPIEWNQQQQQQGEDNDIKLIACGDEHVVIVTGTCINSKINESYSHVL